MGNDKQNDQLVSDKPATSRPTNLATDEAAENERDPLGRDPTRFGDWEKNGRCIDF